MTARELYAILDRIIPSSLSCDWDNDGLMVEGDTSRPITRALVALDATEDTVSYACENDFDLIVTHHPLIFHPLKALTASNTVARTVCACIKSGISVMSFHTRLDALPGGVNDALAAVLGLNDVQPLPELGRVGQLPAAMPIEDFVGLVKDALGCDAVNFVGEHPVSRVAVVGGDGKDLYKVARASDADTYVTGAMNYNMLAEAAFDGMNVIEAGHFHTENPVCAVLSKMLGEQGIAAEIFYSNPVSVCLSDNFT